MIKRPDWIICSQTKEALARFNGRVVWVNHCLRCKTEEPVREGPLSEAISKSQRFIEHHRGCQEMDDVR